MSKTKQKYFLNRTSKLLFGKFVAFQKFANNFWDFWKLQVNVWVKKTNREYGFKQSNYFI